MNRYYIQSRLLRWLLSIGILFLLIMTLLRIVFVIAYKPATISWGETRTAFVMGFRYDLRIICTLLLLLLLIGSIKFCNPFESRTAKRIIICFIVIFIFVFAFFYAIDFAHFSYLSQRLNAQVLNYLNDKKISFNMVWQSYPVIKIIIGLIITTVVILWLVKKLYQKIAITSGTIKKINRVGWSLFLGPLFAIAVFGRIGQFPLRWSDAFSLGNDFKANLSLNPFQSFLSTLTFRKSTYDLKGTREYYSLMADHLGVEHPDSELLNYERVYTEVKNESTGVRSNIVLVICESFSSYKSSMWGNPLNTTPYFNQLCKKGIFFDRCFTPAFGTARGVWATITGIPDVAIPRTASRNPNMVNQATIINDFRGYRKMYFLGGSASWANIRGVLMNNINDLHIYEEQNYKSPKIDVWGISDKNLFLEANNVIRQQQSPFFAIIQTSDNHRPYTIPKEDLASLNKTYYLDDSLKKYGFNNNDEINAFRYTDYCFQQFIEAARKEKYFKNTIFVFVGDHGIRGDAGDMFPRSWSEQGLTCEHVPLLFYSPEIIKPEVVENISSQIDILPSLAALTGISYHNNTLGRNLFDSTTIDHPDNPRNCAFIIDHDTKQIGLVTNKYYYQRSLVSGKEQVVSIIDNKPVDISSEEVLKINFSRQLTKAYFETSRYLLFNNKKEKNLQVNRYSSTLAN